MYPGHHAAVAPNRPAVIMAGSGRVVTYGALEDHANRLAQHWWHLGLRKGDHVAMLVPNVPEAFEVYWAALRSGLYVTAVNRHLTADEAAYVITDCGARSLVVSADLGAAVADRTPLVEDRLSLGQLEGHKDYAEALATASPAPLPDRPRGADMLYSSGTTGRPKGIQPSLPEGQVDEVREPLIALAAGVWGFGPDSVYLSPAPVYHAAPLRFGAATLALGGTVVVMERFEALDALIEKHRVTHSQWVPTMFVRMLKLPEAQRSGFDLSSLRVALHAAAPCPVEVKQAMLDWWGPIVHEYWSSTEANGLTLIGPDDWLSHPGSVGRAALGVLHICDDDGRELPVGEVGTVYVERDELPFRYHGDPAKTVEAQHPAHPTWTTTGDLGRLDDQGFLYLTDRKAFMIISGGVNIYPQEVEDALALHPLVADAAVLGVPDEEMGQRVKAFVQPAGEPPADLAAQLEAFLQGRIASYKVPRDWELRAELPRTPTGKLVKGRLL